MKIVLRLAAASLLASSAAIMYPAAHAAPTGTGCVAVPDPTTAREVQVAGSCTFTATGTATEFHATAGHWQVLVNGTVTASGFDVFNGSVATEPGDTVEALVFPTCAGDTCSATGFVALLDGNP